MNSKTFGYLFFFLTITIFVVIIMIDNKKSEKIKAAHRQLHYKELTGIVYKITQNRGTVILRLKEDSKHKYYFGVSRNYDLSPCDIERFVQKGDSVYKPPKSDKLTIHRNNNQYYFILDKSINKDFR